MRTIHKYQPEVFNVRLSFKTYEGAKFLDAQMQHGVFTIWMEVDTDKPQAMKDFEIVGTGNSVTIPENEGHYVATVQMGIYVWHLYELRV